MKISLKKLIVCAISIAFCVILPYFFHLIPNGGKIFSPMHIPVLICGLLLPPGYGLTCGICGVLLSSALTSMPPAPVLPGMLVECAVYGLAASLISLVLKADKSYVKTLISLVLAMIAGRLCAGIATAYIFTSGGEPLKYFTSAYLLTGAPGIILHLVIIPPTVIALKRAVKL